MKFIHQKPHHPGSLTRSFLLAALVLGLLVPFVGSTAQAEWQLRRKDRWSRISKRLEAMLLARPESGYALKQIMRHYRKKGGTKALLKRLHFLQKKRPNSLNITQAIALIYLKSQRYQKAIRLLKFLKSRKTSKAKSMRLHEYLGKAYLRQSQWKKARRIFLKLLAQTPAPGKKASRSQKAQRLRILQLLLQLSERQRQWKLATIYGEQILQLNPKNVQMRLRLAQFLKLQGRPKEAIQQLQRSLKRLPRTQRPSLYKELAVYHLQANDFAKSLKAIQIARSQLAPRHWLHRELLVLEIQVHRKQGTLLSLVQIFEKKAKRNKRLYLPKIAEIQKELGLSQAALRTYEKLFKQFPAHPHFDKAIQLLFKEKRYQTALTWLKKQQKRTPKNALLRLRLIETHHLMSNRYYRDILFRQSIDKEKKNARFLQKLSKKSAPWKTLPLSLQKDLFRTLCALPPPRASCYQRWGRILWRSGDAIKAWSVWEKLRTIYPKQASDLFLLVKLYKEFGSRRPPNRHFRYRYRTPPRRYRYPRRYRHRYRRRYPYRYRRRTKRWPPKPKRNLYHHAIEPLLREILVLAPYHYRARLMLANLLRKKQKPAEAQKHFRLILGKASGPSLLRQAMHGLIQNTVKQYGYASAARLFRQNYILSPFQKQHREILLAFHIRYKNRGAANQILRESLTLFPKNLTLHRIAYEQNRGNRQGLLHLKQMILLNRLFSISNIKEYIRLSHTFRQNQTLLPFLRKLSKDRWPYTAEIWKFYGAESLKQGDAKQAEVAYRKALLLKPNPPLYRLGLAKSYQKRAMWKLAFQFLQKPPLPKKKKAQNEWLTIFLQSGLKSGKSPIQLWKQLSKMASSNNLFSLRLLELLQSRSLGLSKKEKSQFLNYLLRKHTAVWHRLLLRHKSAKVRYQVLALLLHTGQGLSEILLYNLLRDQEPRIRGTAVIILSMQKNLQHYLTIEKMERSDRHYSVRIAASLAGTWLAGIYSQRTFAIVGRWGWLSDLALQLLQETPHQKIIPGMIGLYSTYQLHLRPQILRIFHRFPPNHIKKLQELLNGKAFLHKCFALYAKEFLEKTNDTPAKIKHAVSFIKINDRGLYRRCRHYRYNRKGGRKRRSNYRRIRIKPLRIPRNGRVKVNPYRPRP